MYNTKIVLIVIFSFIASSAAVAGTILLMGIGLGTPASGPPPTCTNKLDFSQACNSQYISIF